MELEARIIAALVSNADDSWSWLDRLEPAVLTRRPEPGSPFAANIVVIKNAEGDGQEIREGVLLSSSHQSAQIVRERSVRISIERGVTITQESVNFADAAQSVVVTSSATGSQLQPTADLVELVLQELTRGPA